MNIKNKVIILIVTILVAIVFVLWILILSKIQENNNPNDLWKKVNIENINID